VDLGNGLDVLDEVELLVAGGGPEVIPHHRLGLPFEFAVIGDIGDAGLFAKGRIG
jgi:hypothetical protein